MTEQLCEHKFRAYPNSTKGQHCPHCHPYRVGEVEFETFEAVVNWAWNHLKIDYHGEVDLSEEEKQQACEALESIVNNEYLEEEKDVPQKPVQ